MSLLPLIIDDAVREELRTVVARAAADPVSLEQLHALVAGELLPEEVSRGKSLGIPAGFHVVYTHEHQANGVLRHLSVSIDLPGRVPHPAAVQMIMEEIGFILPLAKCQSWVEPCGNDRRAVNVVEPLDGDWTPHIIRET